VHSFTVHLEGAEAAPVEAQVVQAHAGMSLFTIFNEIYDLNLDGRLRTEVLIVRLPVEQQWGRLELEGKTSQRVKDLFAAPYAALSEPFDRVRDRSVHILASHDGRHFLTANLSPYWPEDPLARYGISEDDALAAIRWAEFEHILECSRAVFTSPPGAEFRAPSGRLVKSFIRVGNIQYNRDAIDAIFFWMLPYLVNVGAILTDTWSISSIAFNVARLCAIYFSGPPRLVEMLPSYNDGSDQAQARSRAVVERLDADFRVSRSEFDEMLCLISASQTGSLAGHIDEIFGSSSLALYPSFLIIFALGETEQPSLHDLHGDNRFTLLVEPEERVSEPVAIDPQVYFPVQFEDTIFEIDKAVADRSRPFFDRYVGHRLIDVHRTHDDGAARPRHQAIHISTDRLLEVPEFIGRFEAELEKLQTRPMFIVSPPHLAGSKLAVHAGRYFSERGHTAKIFAHPNLYIAEPAPTAEEQALRDLLTGADEADAILVLDDAAITGARLSQYQRYIRTEGYRGRIDYLVAVARPARPDVWTRLKRYLAYRGSSNLPRHTVSCVEFLLLPDWHEDSCPWCQETRLYQRWLKGRVLPERLAGRVELLSGSSTTGLTSSLFLELPGLPSLKLGPQSLFTGNAANQAEVVAVVASALQYLRSEASGNRPPLGPRRYPVSTVLNHDDYLCSKWTDSILRATFLRVAVAEELVYANPHKEAERSTALIDLLLRAAEGEHDIALEILLAANMKKCAVDRRDEVGPFIRPFGAPESSSFLLERLADQA
jgi:hypothetical protein